MERITDNGHMARPLRSISKVRTVVVRRRHRTWMLSMALASLGWGVWWCEFALRHFVPDSAPSLAVAAWFASAFALLGLLVAIWTIRAKAAWLIITMVPMLANASLLALPWLLSSIDRVR